MTLLGLLLTLGTAMQAIELHDYCRGFLNMHEERAEIPDAAGPVATPGGPRGLLVYRCDSPSQAEEWTDRDPAVVNKRLRVEMHRWTSNGVWGEPLAAKLKSDPNHKYAMVRLPFAILMRTEKTVGETMPPGGVRKAHLAYAMKLVEQGSLRSFGPFESSKDKLAVFVYSAMAMEDAQKLAEQDPLVTGGWARPVLHVWYVADEAVPRR
jgi:uncharacterized protein YciI